MPRVQATLPVAGYPIPVYAVVAGAARRTRAGARDEKPRRFDARGIRFCALEMGARAGEDGGDQFLSVG